ncbi:MAG: HlyD family secretion protein [Planctomyces sp.]|nr:HlyD family secretion protein [Planctomyces sp.]
MIRQMLLPIVALGLLAFAVLHVVRAQQPAPPVSPPIEPPRAPYRRTVAGAGIVEARTENISVGSQLPGIVVDVDVVVGAQVEAGAPLFRLDDRQTRADLKARQANLAAARAELAKLDSLPRPEELPAAEARIREADANLVEQKSNYERVQRLDAEKAATAQEVVRRRQAMLIAEHLLARSRADYDLLIAGAWEPDKLLARAKIEQAEAEVVQVETQLARLQVQAPVAGEVLQVNVRPGEFVGAPPGQPLIVLGNVNTLHVRVDIDEYDIPRFRPGAPATATLRGDPTVKFNLTFRRVEPYVVPKRSLTGDNTERVDTRVLQVIYEIEPGPIRLYVGQQLDAFVDAEPADPPVPASTGPPPLTSAKSRTPR